MHQSDPLLPPLVPGCLIRMLFGSLRTIAIPDEVMAWKVTMDYQ